MSARETFTGSRFGTVATTIGVAVGLGNLWRFPYMVGEFGGSAFVAFYLLAVVAVGVPGLAAEWLLGRHTQRGPVGAFERAGFPGGRALGWIFYVGVTAATGYYAAVIGWTAWHGAAEFARALGLTLDPSSVLPPETGFRPGEYLAGTALTLAVIGAAAAVLMQGVRDGIERVSRVAAPALFAILAVLIVRSLTLEGAREGVAWFVGSFDASELTPAVMVAALGQAVFSLALGGTFMVVYGSYMGSDEELLGNAVYTAAGDTAAGLLGGLAIFPAVFALGLEPASGPDLVFATLPRVFGAMPGGSLLGGLFFAGLTAAAFLSAVAAFEVLVAGLTDNTRLGRRTAVWTVAGTVALFSLPPTVNMAWFVPWDLAFGSGLQMGGALLAALCVGWALDRGAALHQLVSDTGGTAADGDPRGGPAPASVRWLYLWVRYVIPGAITLVAGWWLVSDVLGMA